MHAFMVTKQPSVVRHLWRSLPATTNTSWRAKFHTSCVVMDLNSDFDAAKSRVNSLKSDPGNEGKLKLYALYKQATSGPNTTAKPGMLDFVAKAKWDAWQTLGKLSQDDAKRQYIEYISSFSPESGGGEESNTENRSGESGQFKEILYEKHGNLTLLTINRMQKRNALNEGAYMEIIAAFDQAANDSECRILAITGAGEFYSSGNDLSNFGEGLKRAGSIQAMAGGMGKILDDVTSAFLNFPKPLVALVNGPAVGIAVTTLALCDVVYASDSATFHTPFAVLGQTPEGISSLTFPLSMGLSNANEMLLLGKKISAQQAQQRGLVTEVYPSDVFVHETVQSLEALAKSFAKVPESLLDCKRVLRRPHLDMLQQTKQFEVDALLKRWTHRECMEAVQSFMMRKK